VILARPARAGVEVVLEVRVRAADLDHSLERTRGQRRPAEVRVHDHAGRVEHAAEDRPACRRELLAQACREVAGLETRPDLSPRAVDHGTGGAHGQRVVDLAGELVDRRKVSQVHQLTITPGIGSESPGLPNPLLYCRV